MRPRIWRALLVLGFVLGASPGDAAPTVAPVRQARIVERSRVSLEYPDSPKGRAPKAWAVALHAVEVRNRNTNARAKVRLYGEDGEIDPAALRTFMRVAASSPDLPDAAEGEVAEPLDTRLVQLVFRSAYHFGGAPIVIVSATRKGSPGKHGSGDALDFQLDGVKAPVLAAYTRTYPRAGVGVYTHPKTQYIHLDVREQSYHWIDASPPGVTWREGLLRDPTRDKRDASYVAALDLPEGAAL